MGMGAKAQAAVKVSGVNGEGQGSVKVVRPNSDLSGWRCAVPAGLPAVTSGGRHISLEAATLTRTCC